jgi:hypothetical protein
MFLYLKCAQKIQGVPYYKFHVLRVSDKRMNADKSFPICTTTKRIFLGWVKEVSKEE